MSSSRRRARPASDDADQDETDMRDDEKQDGAHERPPQRARAATQEPLRPVFFNDQVWTQNQYDAICDDVTHREQPECTLKQEIMQQECPSDENDPLTVDQMDRVPEQNRVVWYAKNGDYPERSRFPRQKKCIDGTAWAEYVSRETQRGIPSTSIRDPMYRFSMTPQQIDSLNPFMSRRLADRAAEEERKRVAESQREFERKEREEKGREFVERNSDPSVLQERWKEDLMTQLAELYAEYDAGRVSDAAIKVELTKLYIIHSPRGEEILNDLQRRERQALRAIQTSAKSAQDKQRETQELFTTYKQLRLGLSHQDLHPVPMHMVKEEMWSAAFSSMDKRILDELTHAERWAVSPMDDVFRVDGLIFFPLVYNGSYGAQATLRAVDFFTYLEEKWRMTSVDLRFNLERYIGLLSESNRTRDQLLRWLVARGFARNWMIHDQRQRWLFPQLFLTEYIAKENLLGYMMGTQPPLLIREDIHHINRFRIAGNRVAFVDQPLGNSILEMYVAFYNFDRFTEIISPLVQLREEDVAKNDYSIFMSVFLLGANKFRYLQYFLELGSMHQHKDVLIRLAPYTAAGVVKSAKHVSKLVESNDNVQAEFHATFIAAILHLLNWYGVHVNVMGNSASVFQFINRPLSNESLLRILVDDYRHVEAMLIVFEYIVQKQENYLTNEDWQLLHRRFVAERADRMSDRAYADRPLIQIILRHIPAQRS